MGAKSILLIIGGVLAGFRMFSPGFFARWIRADFQSLQGQNTSPSTYAFIWMSIAVFGGLSLTFFPNQPLWIFLVIPALMVWRLFWSALLSSVFSQRPSSFWRNAGTGGMARMSLIYLFSAISVQLLSILLGAQWHTLIIIVLGWNVLSLFIFATTHPSFIRFKNIGVRVFSILYLCALELIPIYLLYTS